MKTVQNLSIVAVLSLGLSACGSGATSTLGDSATSSGNTDLETVTIGLNPTVAVSPVYLGIEKGFFEEEGIQVEPTLTDAGGTIVTGVVQGSFDVGYAAAVPVMVAKSKGIGLHAISGASVIAEGQGTTDLVTQPDSGIESWGDLSGKTVSVNSLGAVFDLCLKAVAGKNGVDPDSIELIELPFNQVQPTLEQGQIDAGVLIDPFVNPALDGGLKTIGDPCTSGLPDGAPFGLYFASDDADEAKQQQIEAFLRGLEKAQKYGEENPDELRDMLTQYTNATPEQAATQSLDTLRPELNREPYNGMLELMVEHGFVPSAESVDGFLPE